MRVTDHFTVKGRGIVTIIDALPPSLHEGMHVWLVGGHVKWKVVGIEMHAHGREHANGQPAGLLLQGESPLPGVDDQLVVADEPKRELHMFENGCPEWVVAYDEKDACEVYFLATGVPAEDYEGEDDWRQLDPQATSKFWLDDKGDITDTSGKLVEMTNAEACEKFGHGFYATSEM
jgi:hypothetical protein